MSRPEVIHTIKCVECGAEASAASQYPKWMCVPCSGAVKHHDLCMWDSLIYVCICDRLRACEQRMRDEHSEIDAYGGWVKGYAEGLDAAREAVAALSEQWVCQDTVRDALDAIDALREKR